MQEKGFWDDIKRAEEVTKESKSIKDKIDRYESLVRRLDDVEVLAELAEDDEETINEVIIEIKDIEKKIDEYKIELLLSGEYDKNDAIYYFSPHKNFSLTLIYAISPRRQMPEAGAFPGRFSQQPLALLLFS